MSATKPRYAVRASRIYPSCWVVFRRVRMLGVLWPLELFRTWDDAMWHARYLARRYEGF